MVEYHSLRRESDFDSFHCDCYTPKIHPIANLRFLGYSWYKFKTRFYPNLSVCREFWVSGFDGSRVCSIFSGICHKVQSLTLYMATCDSAFGCTWLYIWLHVNLHLAAPDSIECVIEFHGDEEYHNLRRESDYRPIGTNSTADCRYFFNEPEFCSWDLRLVPRNKWY